jgi:hypothetical protein
MEIYSLADCLRLVDGLAVRLRPTEGLYWLIGFHQFVSLDEAWSLLSAAGLLDRKAYVSMSRPHVRNGVYGVGPDGQAWALFYIQQ